MNEMKCKDCKFCKHPHRLMDDSIVEIKDKWMCCIGSLATGVKPDDSCCFGKKKANEQA